MLPPIGSPHRPLEVKPDLSRQRARRHIVRPAEGRKEVIQRCFVGNVDRGERKTPFVVVAFEQVVIAHRNIKQVTGRNARRIMVVVLRPGGRYLYQIRTILRRSASGERHSERGMLAPAEQSSLQLLVSGEPG